MNNCEKIVEETTGEITVNNKPSTLSRKKSSEGDSNRKKRLFIEKNHTDSSKRQRHDRDLDNSSDDEFTEGDVEFTVPMEYRGGTKNVSNTPMKRSTHQNNDITYDMPTVTSSVLNSLIENPALGELLFQKLELILMTQNQHSTMLDKILSNQASFNIEKPENLPNLPISNKEEFEGLETFLDEELSFEYMKKRLAAVGGSSVRNTVMGILKFLLSNEEAMNFNWAGRDKRPFRGTNMMKVVREAVRCSYIGREEPDLTDKVIEDSVKDWLKLAKARHEYTLKKHD